MTVYELFDKLIDYPESFGYYDEDYNIQDELYSIIEIEDFVYSNKDREVKDIEIHFRESHLFIRL